MKVRYRDLSIEESKKIMIGLLDSFVSFCDAFNLKYSLTAGTLLGSIRHHGFIPWDDDLDVMMPRQDYNTFQRNFPKWSKNKHIKLINPKTHGFYMFFSKIIASNTVLMQNGRSERIGVWIDVFPVDFVNNSCAKDYDLMSHYANEMYYLGYSDFFITKRSNQKVHFLKRLLTNTKRLLARPIKKRIYLRKHFSFIKKNEGSKAMCFYFPHVIKIWSEISNISFDNLTDSVFEGKTYKIISNWDEYLTVHYGDYMKLPSVGERVVHSCLIRKIKK